MLIMPKMDEYSVIAIAIYNKYSFAQLKLGKHVMLPKIVYNYYTNKQVM